MKKNSSKTYIRCILVTATPMTRGDYNKLRGWKVPSDENPKDDGFLIVDPDGYRSWLPKERFLTQAFALERNDRISEHDIPAWQVMGADIVTTLAAGNHPVTLVQRRHPNGFVDHETSACVDPKNYSEIVGSEICAEHLDQKMWDRLGFMLAWAKNGLHEHRPTPGNELEICEYAGPREPVKPSKKRAKK